MARIHDMREGRIAARARIDQHYTRGQALKQLDTLRDMFGIGDAVNHISENGVKVERFPAGNGVVTITLRVIVEASDLDTLIDPS